MPATPRRKPSFVCRELTPDLWPDLERLFGPRGACAGCWCMYWRTEKGETMADLAGAEAKKRFKALVLGGKAHGVLAYDAEGEPVGWASFERRVELPRLDRAPSFRCDDAAEVWSLPCFFVKSGRRGEGVATALLAAAEAAMARRGAKLAEAYPTKPNGAGAIPGAFAWTGVPALFENAGWKLAEARPKSKQRYRKQLRLKVIR